MHQVPVIRNQAHRPFVAAGLVPEIFFDPQREFVRAMLVREGRLERRRAVEHSLL